MRSFSFKEVIRVSCTCDNCGKKEKAKKEKNPGENRGEFLMPDGWLVVHHTASMGKKTLIGSRAHSHNFHVCSKACGYALLQKNIDEARAPVKEKKDEKANYTPVFFTESDLYHDHDGLL